MKIHLVYFSCSRHFNHLILSLRSLKFLNAPLLNTVFLYIDRDDPLSPDQRTMIYELGLPVLILATRYPMARSGINVIMNELAAFDNIAESCSEGDYIGKVDSDILFISNAVFEKVVISAVDMYGQKVTNGFEFIQGGCYFIASKAVSNLIISPLFCVLDILYTERNMNDLTRLPEDAVISLLMRFITTSTICYSKYIDQEPSQTRNNIGDIDKSISMIHFSGKSRIHMGNSFKALFSNKVESV
jgi:hypothetical protein